MHCGNGPRLMEFTGLPAFPEATGTVAFWRLIVWLQHLWELEVFPPGCNICSKSIFPLILRN